MPKMKAHFLYLCINYSCWSIHILQVYLDYAKLKYFEMKTRVTITHKLYLQNLINTSQ